MAYTFVPTVPGEGFVEEIVGEVEVAEAGEGGERRRNGAEEFVCIVGVARTPMGGFLGTLSSLSATKLGSIAIEGNYGSLCQC